MLSFSQLHKQNGRLLGLASLLLGWSLVIALVEIGALLPQEGMMETFWLCLGAIAGAGIAAFDKNRRFAPRGASEPF